MQYVATTKLNQDGVTREFATTVDLDDIEKNGVAWSGVMRQPFAGKAGWLERLATVLNIATICRENGRTSDELAALRIARRMTGGELGAVNERIAECRKAGASDNASEDGLRIVSFQEDPEEFKRIVGAAALANNFHHPGAEYHGLKGVNGQLLIPPDPSTDNVSFAICDKDRRLAVVPCIIQKDDVISWVAPYLPSGGIPIHVHFDERVDNPGKVLGAVLRHLDQLLGSFGAKQIVIREPFQDKMLLYKTLGLFATFSAEVWDRPIVQLTQRDEEQIFAQIRKSYKSHVNWGRANLSMEYLAGEQLTAPEVERVRSIITHCHQTLIQKYGDGMTHSMFMPPMVMCQMNKGEVAIARTKDGTVCGVTVVTDEGGVSSYQLGGSIPQQNKNPGQFIVYDSIIRAKARGSNFFHMNREFAAPVSLEQLQSKTQSVHDSNLIFFKRGFSEALDILSVYKILPSRVGFLRR